MLFQSLLHDAGISGYTGGQFSIDPSQIDDVQPIAIPSISVDEIKALTNYFGAKCFVGEGAFGKVYHGVSKDGRHVAIKKLDSNRQPENELLAQVRFKCVLFMLYPLWYNSMDHSPTFIIDL